MKVTQLCLLPLLIFSLAAFSDCGRNEPAGGRPSGMPTPTSEFSDVPVTAGDVFKLVPGASFGFASYPMAKGARLVVQFTVEGGKSSNVIYSARDPQGAYVHGPETVYYSANLVHILESSGGYGLSWSNNFDENEPKLVRWNYTAFPPGR